MLNKNKSTSAFSLSTFNDVLPVQNEQDTHDAQYTQGAQDTQHTQVFSKRRQKYPRINMAIHDIDYLREIAWINKMTQTEYVNHLLEKDKKQQKEAGIYVESTR